MKDERLSAENAAAEAAARAAELQALEPLGDFRRTHTCGELRAEHAGREVTLLGWVNRVRDLGGVKFIDLRDRHGRTQVVVRPESVAAADLARANLLRQEFVIGVRGRVAARPEGQANPEMPTGAIEVEVRGLRILNRSLPLPFAVAEDDPNTSEDLRLRYRYLELRSERLQSILALRHRLVAAVRTALDGMGFLEIETPLLVKPTPEGARDYVVPSRIHPGKFYALPQSPQLYKQILMVAGCDRYYQIARCLRDEDPRADRQPEFSQIDLEMSYVGEEDVFGVVEAFMAAALCETVGVEIEIPFPRLAYEDAMSRYGSDKPDLRLDLPMTDVTAIAGGLEFRPFRAAAALLDGRVQCLRVPAPAWASRRVVEEELTPAATRAGAEGLAWARLEGGATTGGIGKFLAPARDALAKATGAGDGDLLFFVADRRRVATAALGQVRAEIVRRLVQGQPMTHCFHWIHRFPLFEQDPESGRWAPAHHMFTMPLAADLDRLETDPGAVHAELYDLVLNGVELGSGSIRVHRRDIQERIMAVIGMSHEEMEERFGFLLGAFDYGAPPHGGIALGVDRLVMILAGRSSIRETIAFPKTARATSLMDEAPAAVPEPDLRELHIRLLE
jgi:aspartyl-tRNA synthetase